MHTRLPSAADKDGPYCNVIRVPGTTKCPVGCLGAFCGIFFDNGLSAPHHDAQHPHMSDKDGGTIEPFQI